jgi:glycosyltransferase involved in cell wall biosynthesis
LHIIRDAEGEVTKDVKIEERKSGNLTETIIYYYVSKKHSGLLDGFFSMRKYSRVFKNYLKKNLHEKGNPSVVHVHVAYKAGLIALWLRKKFDLKYLLTEHWTGYDINSKDSFYSRSEIFRSVVKRIINQAKLIVPVSNDLGNKIKNIASAVNFSVIPNVVNTDFFNYNPEQHNIFRFAHYTSLNLNQKNTDGLLKALAELKKKVSEWECIIYGPADPGLAKIINELGLRQNVKLYGEVSYKGVAELLRSVSVFVSFSNYENQPCSILEALCCGLPVIAAGVGGIPEIINCENGILVKAGDEQELSDAMYKMMTTYNNYNRKQITDKAVEKYSYDAVGKMFESLYKSL